MNDPLSPSKALPIEVFGELFTSVRKAIARLQYSGLSPAAADEVVRHYIAAIQNIL